MAIYTHTNIDLDAAASVWLARTIGHWGSEVRFVPAWTKELELNQGDIAVDLTCGLKGVKETDENGNVRVLSAFASLLKLYGTDQQKEALAWVSSYIDVQDTGQARKLIPKGVPTLNTVLHALKTKLRNDEMTIQVFGNILDGILANSIQQVEAEKAADQFPIVDGVAIIRGSENPMVSGVLFERGARFLVYHDGNNMGVVRSDDVTIRADCCESVIPPEELHEWYRHPSGFLFARGTRKANMTTPSKANAEDLAAFLRRM